MAHIWVVIKIMVPFLGTLNIRCRSILEIQKRTIILTTPHVGSTYEFILGILEKNMKLLCRG